MARADADRKTAEAVDARDAAEKHRIAERRAREETESLLSTSLLQTYQSDMDLASRHYEAGYFGKMNGLLQKHWPNPGEPDLRGFEWYHWWRITQLQGDYQWGGPWMSVAFSPDRSIYAVQQSANWIAVLPWPLHPGEGERLESNQLARIQTRSATGPIAFSPDGKSFLVGDPEGGTIDVYETESWTATSLPAPVGSGVQSIAWCPEGRLMATGGRGQRIVLREWRTRKPLGEPIETKGAIMDLAFASDGKTLWAAMDDGGVEVWDVAERSIRASMTGHGGMVTRVDRCPTTDLFATGGEDQTVRLWDGNHNLVGTYDTSGEVEDLKFSDDGAQLLAATSGNNCVFVWEVRKDPPTLELVHEIKGHSAKVCGAEFVPDKKLVSVSEDATFKEWDLGSCDPFVRPEPAAGELTVGMDSQIEYSADGAMLSVLDDDGELHRWEAQTRRLIDPDSGSSTPGFRVAALSAGGRFEAGLTADGRIVVRSVEGEICWASPERVGTTLDRMAVSADGRTVVVASAAGIHVWNDGRGHARLIPSNGYFREYLPSLSPDGTRLAVSDGHQFGYFTSVWDLRPERPMVSWTGTGWGPEICSQFSPDGSILAIGSWRSDIRLYDAESGVQLHSLVEHRRPVLRLAFSSDGRRLVSTSEDQSLCIWDPETGALLSKLTSAQSVPLGVAWAPAGEEIAALYHDGSIKIWTSGSREEVNADIPHYLYVAKVSAKEGDLERAFLALNHAEEVCRASDPGNYRVRVLSERSKLHVRSGDLSAAVVDLSAALAVGSSADLFLQRGELHLRLRRRGEAVSDYARAIQLAHEQADSEMLEHALSVVERGRPLIPVESVWRYTRDEPEENWSEPEGFDDAEWKANLAPLGTYHQATFLPAIGERGLWLRRSFEEDGRSGGRSVIHVYADDHVEIFLNGRPAASASWAGFRYQSIPCAEGSALRPGKNTIAVHWINRDQGQKFDLGLYDASDEELIADVLVRARELSGKRGLFARRLGVHHVGQRRWAKAAGEFRHVIASAAGKEPSPNEAEDWMRLTALLIASEDRKAYTRVCGEMMARFAMPEAPETAERVAKAGLILPGHAHVEAAVAMARKPFESAIPDWLAPHVHLTAGLADYRAGRFEIWQSLHRVQGYRLRGGNLGVHLAHLKHVSHHLGAGFGCQQLLGDGPRCHPSHGFPGRGSAATAVVAKAILRIKGEVRVPWPVGFLDVAVVLGARVLVSDQHRDGCPCGLALKHPGQDLRGVGLLPLSDDLALARPASVEIRDQILGRQGQTGGTTVHDHHIARTMRLPGRGHPKRLAEAAAAHGARSTQPQDSQQALEPRCSELV